MTWRLAAPAAMVMAAAAAVSAAAISVLLSAPAEVAVAASRGDLALIWRALVGAFIDLVGGALHYL